MFQLVESGRGGRSLHLPAGMVATREGRTLTLWRQDPGLAASIPRTPIRPPEHLAQEPQEVRWPDLGLGIRIRVVKASEIAADSSVRTPRPHPGEPWGGENERRAVFDRAQLDFPLHVRSRRDGDRIQVAGRASIRKVKDVLIAAQVPRRLRPGVPLLVDGAEAQERVLWVAGVARSAHAPAEASQELVEVELFSWQRAPAGRG
ncbi:MAG TPA: tRNA lysidine(34) synthetase TilS, partial [Candidatus Udaeobacter sp.]|nr:tRNA lysidine(34) synthetase TilS [Candidatus Udaeobacter sp.]